MTVEEMTDTLTRLNIETFNVRGDEINAYCAAHEERTGHIDHNPSFWINADNGAFICFSCQWKGNIYTLISYVQGVAVDDAKSWIDEDSTMLVRFEKVIAPVKDVPRIEAPIVITESMLSAFVDVPIEALKARGLLPYSAKKYGIRWNRLENNWVLPMRDPVTNALIGWQEKGFDRRYFKNNSRVKKSEALFGYELYQGGDMIVVESQLDTVRLDSVGITGGVSIMGSTISETQLKLMSNADRLIFALDNDDAGRSASMSALTMCRASGIEAWFFNYDSTDMKDIGAMSKGEIEWGLENARHMIRGAKII